ncbi:MAG: hypothetical protein ACE14P_02020 [Methanotrichaceae archaeon]
MRDGLIGLLALMLLAFIPLSVMAQDVATDTTATISTSSVNNDINGPSSTDSSGSNSTDSSGSASTDTGMPASPVSIQGIWRVSLAGTDITMAINQSGDSLFGQCKFEGDMPWNGVVAGTVSGRIVNIATAALQGKVLVSTDISGTISDDSMTGSYVRSDSSGLAAKGDINAVKISTDTTEYTPAQVEAVAEAPAAQTTQIATEQPQQLGSQMSITHPAVTGGSTKYNDVTNLAKSIDPNILPRHAEL